jgi:hypothetical protein
MSLAANCQYNPKIPADAECHGTGRLKKDYGVEPILRMMNDSSSYSELHNALTDAFDELKIITLLNQDLNKYTKLNRSFQMDIISILETLRAERPVFHSEADFQFALAWKIKSINPTAEIRLEYPPPEDPRKYIDILVKDGNFVYPIELKYVTKKSHISVCDECFNLKEHGAQDCGCYDFVKDICRIESFKSLIGFKNGIVIWLTNDPHYWNPPMSDSVGYAEFSVHEGAELKGSMSWKSHIGEGTIKGREKPLKLNGIYTTHWHNYSQHPEKNGLFRYAVHIIE